MQPERSNNHLYGGEDYETAPTAPGGAAPANPYSGKGNPGASAPEGQDQAITKQFRQSFDAALNDALDNRNLVSPEE
jgi:hypothetical protein